MLLTFITYTHVSQGLKRSFSSKVILLFVLDHFDLDLKIIIFVLFKIRNRAARPDVLTELAQLMYRV